MKAFCLALALSGMASSLAAAQWILLAPPADEATTRDYAAVAQADPVEARANSRISKLLDELKYARNDERKAEMLAKCSYRPAAPLQEWQRVRSFDTPEECNFTRVSAMTEASQNRRIAMQDSSALAAFLALKRIAAGRCVTETTIAAQ
jgi:hypothetical protein